jgi:hypothetical protein
MEPEDVADYAKPAYWNERYTTEARYDWFTSVYCVVVAKVFAVVEELHALRLQRAAAADASSGSGVQSEPAAAQQRPLRVLHLGCGNSSLCNDLAVRCAAANIPLLQTAVDYSEVVIARMQQQEAADADAAAAEAAALRHANDPAASSPLPPIPRVEWLVADVRAMPQIPSRAYDLVIDKGTMDALQADKENETMDEDIAAMLLETSRVLAVRDADNDDATAAAAAAGLHAPQTTPSDASSSASAPAVPSGAAPLPAQPVASLWSVFLQITWEIPYYRLHHTKRAAYVWGAENEAIATCKLGDSDMYRFFRYNVVR